EYFNVPLFLPLPNNVKFLFNKINSDTSFSIGTIKLQTITPRGHTRESVSFFIDDKVVFTGDTVFIDGVGRPDLKANEDESHTRAGLLFQSLKKLISLPQSMLILPAHASRPVEFDGVMICATIAEVKKNIPLLRLAENDFVNSLLRDIPPAPNNYISIVEKNLV